MSSQQFPRSGVLASGLGSAQTIGANTGLAPGNPQSTGMGDEGSRDSDHGPRDHSSTGGGSLPFRDEKQETVVVRPYPQVQTHGQPLTLAQHHTLPTGTAVTVTAPPAHLAQAMPLSFPEGLMKLWHTGQELSGTRTLSYDSVSVPVNEDGRLPYQPALKPTVPSRPIAPAPASIQGHLTMESSMPQASAIPVATISGQQGSLVSSQGHPSNLHHLMTANVQMSIIRSSTPGPPLHIGPSATPQHTFTSHLPRGAAAAAVMSSSKVTTVLRPASGPSSGTGQATVQHIIHQPIQSRPAVTTSTAVPPTVVATVSATRAQSPVITTAAAHIADTGHGRPSLTIHPPPATRITLPSHPALGAQKPQLHTMAQKSSIFSTVTPVAAATVAPILATNTVPSPTTAGSMPHTQSATSTIVTMTMPPHSSNATAATTSTIPVAKVVPQPIAHTSPRIQPDYQGERGNLIPISGHRSSPNPVAMEARNDNRQPMPVPVPMPVQFQYFQYNPSAYPLAHTYTPITSSVSTIRQFPVSAQAPSSAIPAQAGVGVHLNPVQLMTVEASHRLGLQAAAIGTQGIQTATLGTQGIQPAPIGTQGLHPAAPIGTQGIQTAPIGSQQTEAKSVVLADGSTLVANPISNTFSATPAGATTVVQTHPQGGSTNVPTLVSSPRPSILRKKPTNEGSAVRKSLIPAQAGEATSPRIDSTMRSASGSPRPAGAKPKPEIQVEALSNQSSEQQTVPAPPQHPSQTISAILTAAAPPSQPTAALSTLPAAMAVTPPIPASMANVVTPPTQPAVSSTAASAVSCAFPEIKIKQEVEPMETVPPALTPFGSSLGLPSGDIPPGASPRKKPRKQQHVITEESEMMETNSTDEEKSSARPLAGKAEKRKLPPKEYIDEEGVRYVPVRTRPPVTLLRHYRNPWKAAYHHFQRYSDIRVKEEKKGTMQEIANQKGVVCRVQGWKIHLCAAQLLQLTNLEHDVYSRLSTLQEGLIPKKKAGADDDLHRINELIQGNMQRCKLVMDQITEAREAMMKVLDHKDRVMKLLNKNGGSKKASKLKRKEKA
ncbi:histone deacetylase complex subunit SAP130-like isoform X1 [Acipenser ruthenus]|uniref:histone deacetylase complex subunit SAP130-like isoform X1 n=1 Tax=Acipenser ruthenus TaxID=7906 RepID=UPI002741D3D0|nr:histone deacetylase complex subunit SAP130-like isoform X1 [Acipenser ruthenus]XP_033894756.3 histone deacetylase complex subunit SAP130-like isoform X1 [Acipenser ruthenus]